MVSTATFPNANINVQDNPPAVPADPVVIPLHVPIFCTFAEQGPVNTPVFAGSQALQAQFGPGFLNERSPYYNHPNPFIAAALQYQQIFLVRVMDPAATAATLVLLCTVTPGQITQYQRTSSGAIILNGEGQPTPQLMEDGVTPVTAPGITLSFSVRALTSEETISTVATVTTGSGSNQVNTYPLIACSTSPGAGGNNMGFKLFYTSGFDTNLVDSINSMTYSFCPVLLNTTTSIASPIYDIYNNATQTFSFDPNAYYADTAQHYDLKDIVNADFTGTSGLPYQFYVYGANALAIGNAALAVSSELAGTAPLMLNILSGLDQNGNPYEHMVVNSSAAQVCNQNVVQYLQGGTDGQLTKTMLEQLTVAFFTGDAYPQLGDMFRFPITHLYDSGFTLVNKEALLGIFALRDDVKIDFSTQDVANIANTGAQDQSTGAALRGQILLNPESVEFGTQACRASIYQQCGTLAGDTVYTNIVPATLDRLIKRCIYNGTDNVRGEPKGRPNSEVTTFALNSVNWTPSSNQQQQLSWSTGLNYMQYADMQTLFYADLISIYPTQNSLLSSDCFVDYVVYTKHAVRQQWTIYVGRDDPPASLWSTIEKAIDARIAYMFNGRVTSQTVISQNAVQSALGYAFTVTVNLFGNMPNRVWTVIIPINRAATTPST